MTDKSNFYLDRKLSVGVIITLMLQTASALMWAGAAEARIKTLEGQSSQTSHVSERLARLEEKVDLTRETVVRIEQRLDGMSKP